MKDKQYFIDHPDQDEYTRAYVPGEFVPMPKEWLAHGEPDGVIVRRGPADGMRFRMPFKRLKKEEPKWSDIKNAIQ